MLFARDRSASSQLDGVQTRSLDQHHRRQGAARDQGEGAPPLAECSAGTSVIGEFLCPRFSAAERRIGVSVDALVLCGKKKYGRGPACAGREPSCVPTWNMRDPVSMFDGSVRLAGCLGTGACRRLVFGLACAWLQTHCVVLILSLFAVPYSSPSQAERRR